MRASSLFLAVVLWTLGACDKSALPGSPGCHFVGKHYDLGDRFKSSDGCNDCSCEASGRVACTSRACADSGMNQGLSWYQTCGAPVCGPGTDGPTGQPKCTTETVGERCPSEGLLCDASIGCGVNLVCAKSDPTMNPGGCPISRARYKQDIRYLSKQELSRLSEQLLATPLARYRYTHDVSRQESLGFIIEDVEPSPSVAGDHVDLYGYTSMAVATLQLQSERIRALEHEVQQLAEQLQRLERRRTRSRH